MAILSRRSIQKLIDASARFSEADKLRDVVSRLNKASKAALAAEWELIVLNGLANILPVEHEVRIRGRRNLDVRFALPGGTPIIADIVAVSDESYEKDNPTGPLYEEFSRRLSKRGITGRFGIGIGGIDSLKSVAEDQPRKRLKLPRRESFATWIFNAEFDAFLDRILTMPGGAHRHSITNREASIEFVYSPGRGSHTLRHYPYHLPDHQKRNSIHRALTTKAKQIRDVTGDSSGHLRGILLCDAGCRSFSDSSFGPGHVSPVQIIEAFLADRSSVDFVCRLLVTPEYSLFHDPSRLMFEATVFTMRHAGRQEEIQSTFQHALDTMPSPIRTGLQATQAIKTMSKTRRYRDGYSRRYVLTDRMIGISIRALLDYAAGGLTREEFLNVAGITPIEHLKRLLDAGLTVKSVKIENAGIQDSPAVLTDGDLALISFGEKDPAVSDFVEPPNVGGGLSA